MVAKAPDDDHAPSPACNEAAIQYRTPFADVFHDWLLALPWVVERPPDQDAGIRFFAVDCEPLQCRRVWLLTGYAPQDSPLSSLGVNVVLPEEVGVLVEQADLGTPAASLPADSSSQRIATPWPEGIATGWPRPRSKL